MTLEARAGFSQIVWPVPWFAFNWVRTKFNFSFQYRPLVDQFQAFNRVTHGVTSPQPLFPFSGEQRQRVFCTGDVLTNKQACHTFMFFWARGVWTLGENSNIFPKNWNGYTSKSHLSSSLFTLQPASLFTNKGGLAYWQVNFHPNNKCSIF